ncbi:MAG: hypothetical protein E7369_06240, partial [Clostridiales bacterium]|nr:hypothetical protein [Clostridiales bacterium]
MNKKTFLYKKLIIFILVSLLLFTAIAVVFPKGETTTFAATENSTLINDDFNSKKLGDDWINGGTDLVEDYNSLRFNGKYDYGGTVSLVGYEFLNSCKISYVVKSISGTHFSMGFSGRTNLSAYASYQFALSFQIGQTSLATGDGAFTLTTQKRSNDSYFLDYSKTNPVRIDIDVTRTNPDGLYYDLSVSYYDANTGVQLTESFDYQGVKAELNSTLICFNMGNMLMDIISFDIYEDGNRVFYDDFAEDTLSFDGEPLEGSKWRANRNYATEEYLYIAPISKIAFDKSDSFLIYGESMPKGNNYVEKTYNVTFDTFIQEGGFTPSILFGVGFNLTENSVRLDEVNMVGIISNGQTVRPAKMVNRELSFIGNEEIPVEKFYGQT